MRLKLTGFMLAEIWNIWTYYIWAEHEEIMDGLKKIFEENPKGIHKVRR